MAGVLQMRSINVLMITPFYAPDLAASVPIFTALCEDLIQLGCNVSVITSLPTRPLPGPDMDKVSPKPLKREDINGVHIVRTRVASASKESLSRRLLHCASFGLSATLSAFRISRPDIVLADAPCFWTGFPLLLTAMIARIPFIYIIHDIYPDVLARLSIIRNKRILQAMGEIERFYYHRSAHISVLTDGFKMNLVQKGVAPEKISVIPVCVDTGFIRPLPRDNELRRRWGLSGKFVVLYAGNLGLSQSLETVLTSAGLLAKQEEIVFVLVGEGAAKAGLQRRAEEAGLKNVLFFPFLSREHVPLVYSLADVGLISLRRDIVMESIPSKTYSIMASGRPIVATVHPQTDVASLLDAVRCGLCVAPEEPAALAEAILSLFRDPRGCESMGMRGRDHVTANYSRKKAADQYYQAIQSSAGLK